MSYFHVLPLRQKIMLGLTIGFGLFIVTSSTFNLITIQQQNFCIFAFGLGVPGLLLLLDTIVDLDSPPIFAIWLIISIICFILCLFEYGNEKYFITSMESDSFRTKYVSSVLKVPLIFLTVYFFLNKWNKKLIGHQIVNTFHSKSYYHSGENRTITGYDVFFHIILYATIIFSALYGL